VRILLPLLSCALHTALPMQQHHLQVRTLVCATYAFQGLLIAVWTALLQVRSVSQCDTYLQAILQLCLAAGAYLLDPCECPVCRRDWSKYILDNNLHTLMFSLQMHVIRQYTAPHAYTVAI
jgi:hypothetical protein